MNVLASRRNSWRRRLGPLAVSGLLAMMAVAPQSPVEAAVPNEISYQAYLTDAAGFPITAASVDVSISIYNVATLGAPLLTQNFAGLDLSGSQGFINVNVDTSALSGTDLDGELWAEITIDAGGGPEVLTPRQKIVSAPQALNSDLLDGLDSTDLVGIAGVQTVTGAKTFANNVVVTVPTVNTSAAGESGAGLSVLAESDAAAWRAIGARGRVLQMGAEPGGAPPAGLTNRQIQGIVGSVSGEGGANTTLGGGYFNAKLLSSATSGAVQIAGISADGEVEAGATMLPGQLIVGGRFGANNTNAGVAAGVGVVGTALATAGHLGPASGVVGVGAGSATQNAGVVGAANIDPTTLALALSTTPQGVGVYGFNNFPGGVGVKADNGGTGGNALEVSGPSAFTGNVAVTGVVTSTVAPTNPEDLTRKDYVDAAVAAVSGGGGGSFVDLTTAQSVAGEKTFTDNMILDLVDVNTNVSGESGAGWSLLATADPVANRAIGARSRILATAAEPGGGRLVQGMVGSAQSSGGASTLIDGAYFQGRVTSGSTGGAAVVTGVAGEVDVEAGAAGFALGQAMYGGRFNANAVNSGVANAVGAVGLASGAHAGPSAGVVGVGRDSASSNAGVVGAANASDLQVGLLAGSIPAEGVGVYAYNPTAGGMALVANAPSGTAISTNGDVTIAGKATQSVLTPTAAGDLVTKGYFDAAQATFNRTVFVVPASSAATPDGSLAAPYDDINAAYAAAAAMGTDYFDRVAVVLMPGVHTLTSTLDMDTVGVDLIGFGYRSATIEGTVDPLITMTAPTSGAVIQNLRITPSGVSNVGVAANAGGRINNVLIQRPGGGGGTLLSIANAAVAGQSLSIADFEIYGNVNITSYGDQTTMQRGLVTGTITSTSNSPNSTEFLALINMSTIGGLTFTPTAGGILLMNNCPQVLAVTINGATVIRGNSVGFMTAAGVPLALADPLNGSLLTNSTADVSAWTSTVASAGNLAAVGYVAAVGK